MSAIQRDREIAAKSFQGEWRDVHGNPFGNVVVEVVGTLGGLEGRILLDDEAEHIVRLHNRFPKYQELVDAARSRDWGNVADALDALDQE